MSAVLSAGELQSLTPCGGLGDQRKTRRQRPLGHAERIPLCKDTRICSFILGCKTHTPAFDDPAPRLVKVISRAGCTERFKALGGAQQLGSLGPGAPMAALIKAHLRKTGQEAMTGFRRLERRKNLPQETIARVLNANYDAVVKTISQHSIAERIEPIGSVNPTRVHRARL